MTSRKFTYNDMPPRGSKSSTNTKGRFNYENPARDAQFHHSARPHAPNVFDLLHDPDLKPLVTESGILSKMLAYTGNGRSLGDCRSMVEAVKRAEAMVSEYVTKRSTEMDVGPNFEYATKRECLRMIENAVTEGTVEYQSETGQSLPR